jgi:hypothetical protein
LLVFLGLMAVNRHGISGLWSLKENGSQEKAGPPPAAKDDNTFG